MANKYSSIFVTGLVAISTILTGCNRSLNSIAPVAPPRALPSTPAEPVLSNQLPPVNSDQQPPVDQSVANTPTTPEDQQKVQVENVATDPNQPNSSSKISREALAGSWQVPTDGLDCRIILAFTKWSGGYRAATRKCVSPEIQAINAWDVKDQTVVLVDQSGNEVARLFASRTGRYDGRTTSGEAVSFVR
ncbi:MAG: AprI/Inh family metalloprotease inhibitor [Hyphomicrobiales bacterium]|nr:AprI/Inh family metalloprotease inhibitor [Hyphomicrobiales bacterium]